MKPTENVTATGDPFFLVCKARSGSTFLSNLLTKTSNIIVTPESRFIEHLWNWSVVNNKTEIQQSELSDLLDKLIFSEKKFAAWEMTKEYLSSYISSRLPLTISGLARSVIHAYADNKKPEAQLRGLKKGGWYVENIAALRRLFPSCKIIHLIRDGRAVFSSSKMAEKTSSGRAFEDDPLYSAYTWKKMVDSVTPHLNGGYVLEVKYEDLIEEPDEIVKQITSFLTNGQQLSAANSSKAVEYGFYDPANKLHKNISSPPMRERINAWKKELTADEIARFESISGSTLEQKGYSLEYKNKLPLAVKISKACFLVKRSLVNRKRRRSGRSAAQSRKD